MLIFSGMFCAILPLIADQLRNAEGDRELFQPAAWSPLTVKIELM